MKSFFISIWVGIKIIGIVAALCALILPVIIIACFMASSETPSKSLSLRALNYLCRCGETCMNAWNKLSPDESTTNAGTGIKQPEGL